MSGWLTAVVWCLLIAVALATALSLLRTARPIRNWLSLTAGGLLAVTAVNLFGTFTGVSLGFGYVPLASGAVLGVPGVIAVLLARILMI